MRPGNYTLSSTITNVNTSWYFEEGTVVSFTTLGFNYNNLNIAGYATFTTSTTGSFNLINITGGTNYIDKCNSFQCAVNAHDAINALSCTLYLTTKATSNWASSSNFIFLGGVFTATFNLADVINSGPFVTLIQLSGSSGASCYINHDSLITGGNTVIGMTNVALTTSGKLIQVNGGIGDLVAGIYVNSTDSACTVNVNCQSMVMSGQAHGVYLDTIGNSGSTVMVNCDSCITADVAIKENNV